MVHALVSFCTYGATEAVCTSGHNRVEGCIILPIPLPDYDDSIEYQRLWSVLTLQMKAAFGSEKQAASGHPKKTRVSRHSMVGWRRSRSELPYLAGIALVAALWRLDMEHAGCCVARALHALWLTALAVPRPSLVAAPGWFAHTAACVGQLLPRTATLSYRLAQAWTPISSSRCKCCGVKPVRLTASIA